jgi:hypothetical protein
MVALPADRLGKVPGRVRVGVYLDDALMDAVADATRARDAAQETADVARQRAGLPGAPTETVVDAEHAGEALDAAQTALDEAEASLDEGTLWFTFRSLGRKTYRKLLDAHPATDDDHTAARDQGQPSAAYSPLTFAPALVRAACADPVLSAEDVEAIFDGDAWSDGDVAGLFTCALTAQVQSRTTVARRVTSTP